jgi:hypothetical protein
MRRGIVTALIAGIALFSFQPFYVRIFFVDRQAMSRQLAELPYHLVPGFRDLMLEVRDRVPEGSNVALVTPFRDWPRYGYCFHRARYLLAGRQVVPLVAPSGEVELSNLGKAQYVVAYNSALDSQVFEEVFRSRYGVLLRRRV